MHDTCTKHTFIEQGHSQPHSPRWARDPLSSLFSSKFDHGFLFFPQTLLIFFLILALRVGESPTLEGPGYATVIERVSTKR